MKIVHLNTYDGNGGAGRAVLRLNKGLQQIGLNSRILCLYQFNSASEVTAISQTFFGKIRALANIMAERFLIKPFLKNKSIPFSLQRFGLSPNHLRELQDADIIHIHWINHGFLTAKNILELSGLNKKIVWTTHDSNPFTGGCHVRYNCRNFEKECGNCPVLANSGYNDLSHKTWIEKNKAYQAVDFCFVAPSTWMAARAREASLAKGKRVEAISNALETDIFSPLDKANCRRKFDIDQGAIVILAGYMPSKADRHKGFPELIETLHHLSKCSTIDKDKLVLIFYGSDGKGVDFNIPINHKFVGRISSDQTLVELYSLADVFLFTSLEESMGYTALESIACGTPVAAFRTSGVTDVVIHQKNGFLAELKDTEALAEGIVWILKQDSRSELASFGRDWAVSHFSLNVIASKHRDLYTSLLTE